MTGPSIDMTQQAEFKNNTRVGVISSAETAGSARFPGKPEALFKQPQDLEEGHMAARVNREAFPRGRKTAWGGNADAQPAEPSMCACVHCVCK